MKYSNAKYFAQAFLDGEIVAVRVFVTEQAKNNWCNKQYNVFGEDVTVEVRNYKTFALLETWHA